MAKQIFEGLKILDMTTSAAGPMIGRELAEHGATVVKIENHRYPSSIKFSTPYKDNIPGMDRSAFGTCYETQKYGLSVDYKYHQGLEVIKKLIEWADLFLDSYSPGALIKYGLDYDSVRKIKPDIIYLSSSQFGSKGPLSQFAGYGILGCTHAGLTHILGWSDRRPLPPANNHTDNIAPFYAIGLIIQALLNRRKTGRGMFIDLSQAETALMMLSPMWLQYFTSGYEAGRMGNRDPYMSPHGIFWCSGEDRAIAIAIQNEEQWKTLCALMGNPEWTKQKKFSTLVDRKRNEDELETLLEEWTKTQVVEELMNNMQEKGVPAGVVALASDLHNDPQMKHRGHFVRLNHKIIGDMAFHAPAYKLSKTPYQMTKAAPCAGEDNEFVLKEILGYSDEDIADLLIEGALTTETDMPVQRVKKPVESK